MVLVVFFKQKTAYEMRISDWSSDVCSSDLASPMVNVSDLSLKDSTSAALSASSLPTASMTFAFKPPKSLGGVVWSGEKLPLFTPSMAPIECTAQLFRSEERRVGKSVSGRLDLGGRGVINKKKKN